MLCYVIFENMKEVREAVLNMLTFASLHLFGNKKRLYCEITNEGNVLSYMWGSQL